MSLDTPTTLEINAEIIAQLEASLNQTIPLLPKSFLRVLAKVLAAVFVLLYKYGGFTFQQIFVQTASAKETDVNGQLLTPLVEWGRLIGVGDPIAAVRAELLIDITVEVQSGTLPSNSQLVNAGNGVTYVTLGSVLLDAPTVQATIRAVSDQAGGSGAGAIGNLAAAAIVSFANPLANVARDAAVVSQSVNGADAEATEVYRQRVIDRFQKLPQGGAYADYELWGEEVEGIINVYPYTSTSPGVVDLFSEATEASSGSADGIPTAAQLQAVLDSVELDEDGLPTRRPANALVTSSAITRVAYDVIINGLVADNLPQVQADTTAAVEEYFLSRGPFIVGLTPLPRTDRITQNAVAGTVEDIVSAAGGVVNTVVLEKATVPFTIDTLDIGEKAKADSVSYT